MGPNSIKELGSNTKRTNGYVFSPNLLDAQHVSCLPPEEEVGNIEYKLKLLNPSPCRLEHLVTQMKWRLEEGQGEAIYKIGVEDCGRVSGLLKEELDLTLATLQEIASRLQAKIFVRKSLINEMESSRYAVEVLVQKMPDRQEFVDVRVAVLGNVDAGKSTLLGVLGNRELDNGRGKARLNLFRHLHEIESGRTSSISREIIGYDSRGQILNYTHSAIDEICSRASKMITFIDLAGHCKYMKTTIFGLTGYSPEVVVLVVGANNEIVGTTKEHLGLVIALRIPFLIVVNKIDLCSEALVGRTVAQLEKILKSSACKKFPHVIGDEDDVVAACGNFTSGQVTPIFKVSCVTGQNLDLLRSFFFRVPSIRSQTVQDELDKKPVEFRVDEVFHIPGVSPVIGGTLIGGTLKPGDRVSVGPNNNGEFVTGCIESIHRNRSPCQLVLAGQAASVAVKVDHDIAFRKGHVILSSDGDRGCCQEFVADVFLLFHATKLSKDFQATVHIGNVVQTARILEMDKECIRTGQRARIRFRFLSHPERIHVGNQIFIHSGRTKGIGEVTKVDKYEAKEATCCGFLPKEVGCRVD